MATKHEARPDSSLLHDLTAIVGRENVLASAEDREEYAYDAAGPGRVEAGLRRKPPLPDAVVRPASVEEVRRVVRLASDRPFPIVPYGGGTGVLGGTVPVEGGVVLDLRRLDRLLRVNADAGVVFVQAGAILGGLAETLEKHGLLLGHDPWSQGIATVGGAISTGGAGYLAARYGTIAEQVLGLEVVLPGGGLLEARQVSASAGPRLHCLFVGAEGALGVITAATLRVFPLPERRTLRAFAFGAFEPGYNAVLEMGRRGVRPSMIDYSQRPPTAEALLYLAFEGLAGEVEAHQREGVAICMRYGGRDLGAAEAQRFWDNRHAPAEMWAKRNAAGRRFARASPWSPGQPGQFWDYLDPAVPPERLLEYKRRCEALLAQAGLAAREFDIWGRPDLFTVVVITPEGKTADPVRSAQASERIMRLAQEMGGSMEFVHGVGVKLLGLLPSEPGAGLEALRAVKKALDPANIMNPGKLGL